MTDQGILVDPQDEHLLALDWRVYRYGKNQQYATRWVNGVAEYLHRRIAGAGQGREVDHINGNGLDNRRANLRVVRHGENLQNQRKQEGRSSRYRGVSWWPARGVWAASAKLDGRKRHIGYFKDEDEAGRAAAEWRAKHMPFSSEALSLGAS